MKNSTVNIGILCGKLIDIPRLTNSSTDPFVTFTIVTEEGYFDDGKNFIERPEFHNCQLTGDRAIRFAEKFKKMDVVQVYGSWVTNKKGGRFFHNLQVSRFTKIVSVDNFEKRVNREVEKRLLELSQS